MHYYLSSIARYSREPDKFIKTARNISRGALVNTYVVSWPKTGRTWLRVLMGKSFATRKQPELRRGKPMWNQLIIGLMVNLESL